MRPGLNGASRARDDTRVSRFSSGCRWKGLIDKNSLFRSGSPSVRGYWCINIMASDEDLSVGSLGKRESTLWGAVLLVTNSFHF